MSAQLSASATAARAHQEMFAYWASLRRGASLPARVDRAQTVLRYWNWSLTSALTPALLKAIRDGDEAAVDEYSAPQRAAMLALSRDFGR